MNSPTRTNTTLNRHTHRLNLAAEFLLTTPLSLHNPDQFNVTGQQSAFVEAR